MSHTTSSAAVASKGSKKQVPTTANTTRRVVETRDQWQVIFDYSVSLVVAYTRGQKPTGDVRKGFAFGSITEQPHSRAYAQALLGGFLTSKAGKVLKDFDDLAQRESREKIAIAILLDTKLAKDGTEGAKRILGKDAKREKAFAEAVLTELQKPVAEPTTEGGEDKPKPTTKGGSKSKTETKKATTTKGGSKSSKATK